MGKDKLTAKQQAFVVEYAVDGNGKRAAIAAGYAPKHAEVTASKLLRVPKVAARVDHYKRELADRAVEKASIDAAWVLRELAYQYTRCKEKDDQRTAASILGLVGRHVDVGSHIERTQNDHTVAFPDKIPVEFIEAAKGDKS